MSYTNMRVPNRFSTLEMYHEKTVLLEHKIAYLENKLTDYQSMLENIHRAIAEYGYIELADDLGKNKIKLGIIP